MTTEQLQEPSIWDLVRPPRLANRSVRWMLDAECRWHDPELFYPEDYKEATQDRAHVKADAKAKALRLKLEAEAKFVCSYCPVQAECLGDAIRLGDFWGIRAGMTGRERARLLDRRLPRVAQGEVA